MPRKKACDKEEQKAKEVIVESQQNNLEQVADSVPQLELNFDTLTKVYNRGSFEVIQALFGQATEEADRLRGVRENLKKVEANLFEEARVATMSTDELIKVADLSQRALSNSTNYLFKLHGGLTAGLEVIGTLKNNSEASTIKPKIDSPELDTAKRELGDMLLQKIKEKTMNP